MGTHVLELSIGLGHSLPGRLVLIPHPGSGIGLCPSSSNIYICQKIFSGMGTLVLELGVGLGHSSPSRLILMPHQKFSYSFSFSVQRQNCWFGIDTLVLELSIGLALPLNQIWAKFIQHVFRQ